MQIKKSLSAWLAAAAATLMLTTPAQASPVPGQGTWDNPNPAIGLQARDLNGDTVTDAFYDPKLNITWLRDANVNGYMDWNSAVAWAAGYSIGSYSDWRLPTMVDTGTPGCNISYAGGTDCGYNVQTTSGSTVYSEMASLWYDTLGNKAYCDPATSTTSACVGPQAGWGLTNTGDFLNLQSYVYWSGLEYAPYAGNAWLFYTDGGTQLANYNGNQYCAMAVRPGDVAGAQVPEPETLVLALTALAGLGLVRRRRPMKIIHKTAAGLVAIASLFVSASCFSSPIPTSFVRGAGFGFEGMAVDSLTGVAYQLDGYGPGYMGSNPTRLTTFANAAAFEANVSSGTVVSATNLWGTYIAAQNGSVFGRSSVNGSGWPVDAQTTKLSGSTGAVQTTVTVAGMGGSNALDTFNWGGFSGVNAINDGSNLYVVGGIAASNDWRITTFDYALNQTGSVRFSPTRGPGFGFAMDGYIFFGDSYSSGQISTRVNAATGLVESVDFTLTGLSSFPYLSDASYDAFNDTLYLYDSTNSDFRKVSNASLAFGVDGTVPEPGTLALLGLALAGMGFTRRKAMQA